MASIKKIILVLIGLLVVVIVMVEMNLLVPNLYHSELSVASKVNWSVINREENINIYRSRSNFANKEVPIVVISGKDTLYKKLNGNGPIIVIKVDSIETGRLWIPFYKSATFSAVGIASLDQNLINVSAKQAVEYKSGLFGTLRVRGKINVAGLCSYRQVIKMLHAAIAKNFANEAEKYTKSLPFSYF